jgi:acylphosphatase
MILLVQGNYINMEEKAGLSLVVNGRVQGVFFRLRAKQEAEKLGLSGWVRNNPAGSVESLVEGDKAKLEEFITWCKQGPKHAQVTELELKWLDYSNQFSDFKII